MNHCTKKANHKIRAFLAPAAVALMLLVNADATQKGRPQPDASMWKPVEAAMGRPGTLQPDGVFKFSMPRKDMRVTVQGTPIHAGLALGSWTAFLGKPGKAMAMGDLVLSEDEVGPVMLKLQQEGVQITAVHNHLLHETPRVVYMHIEGHGNAARMAKAIRDALALTKTPAQIGAILGRAGKVNGGILQVSVPRPERITDAGMEVPPSMGTATALNFEPTGAGRAAITGDFVLLAEEVNPVLTALRDNGIQVTALHSHMLNEQPRLFFMHFWANDDALKLARGLRAALDLMKSTK